MSLTAFARLAKVARSRDDGANGARLSTPTSPSAIGAPSPPKPDVPKVFVCPRCDLKWDNIAPIFCPDDHVLLMEDKAVTREAEADPMSGRTLDGRYTLTIRLGAGSMGTVYRAKQHAMGREVAIKILRSDRALDDASKARFLREARANSLLASPNTVTVFDFGQSESGEFYLAMELLEGESLGQRLARTKRLPVDVAVDTARQALRSLAEAHAKGIIHRDLKPDNLFYARVIGGAEREEIVKVVDFGIAKMLTNTDGPMDVVETQAGTVFGTPRFMSPEQAQGKPLDPRSDLYSLGVILYQMLTGRPPFTDDDAILVMARHIKTAPKPPSQICPEAAISPDVERVVLRALAKDPEDRPANAEAMAAELLQALENATSGSSGVRVSVTNAAGVRIPESMRPPPIALPELRERRLSNVMLGGIFLALAVFAGAVAFLLGRTSPTSPDMVRPPAPTLSASSAATPIPTPPTASPRSTPPVEPATVPAESLPKSSATEKATPAPPRGYPKIPPKRNGAPQPSASASYGIFD